MHAKTPSLAPLAEAFVYRSKVLAAVRRAFDSEGFIETETPVGLTAPAMEEYIAAPAAGKHFLRTSPELEMKRLLCAGMERIYEIGPCFRNDENGRIHRPEFTMLEYYQAHSDYRELLAFTRRFVLATAEEVNGTTQITFRGHTIDLAAECEILSVRDAFSRWASKSADSAAEEEGLFELLLTTEVEPNLPSDRPCVLIDYPIRFGAFARAKKEDPTLAERWELYIGGVELANAYGELTDPKIQRERFAKFAQTRVRNGMELYPEPVSFLQDFDLGMPEAAGAAMGFDRLVMILRGASSLAEVSYPLDDPA